MSAEQNKAIVRKIFDDGMNGGNSDIFDQFLSDKFVNHDMPAPVPGPEGMKQVLMMFKTAFPDMKINLRELIAEGDKVVTRGNWTGTHKGNFMGVPATDKNVDVSFMDIWHIENGKCTENWVKMDLLGLMRQLGVVPAM